MNIEGLRLTNHRNYNSSLFKFGSGLNIIIGPNGAGKTNVLEALYLLSLGRSHRTKNLAEMIRNGADELFIEAEVSAAGSSENRVIAFSLDRANRKRMRVNGIVKTRSDDYTNNLVAVIFSPDDLLIVKGEPENRRCFLNDILTQTSPVYRHNRGRYVYALRQRNELLKKIREGASGTDELDALDQITANYGAPIMRERALVCGDLSPAACEVFQRLMPHRTLRVEYRPKLETDDVGPPIETLPASEIKDLSEMLVAGLMHARSRDIRSGVTSVGPHRDELEVELDGLPVKTYASQGEQRAAVLALKFAELKLKQEHFNDKPVLLLDDVLSELDADRRSALLGKVDEGYQTIITTTNIGYFNDEELERSQIIELDRKEPERKADRSA